MIDPHIGDKVKCILNERREFLLTLYKIYIILNIEHRDDHLFYRVLTDINVIIPLISLRFKVIVDYEKYCERKGII